MGIQKKIIQPSGPIMITASGNIDGKEIIKTLQEILSDPNFIKSMDILWDFRAVTSKIIKIQQIKHIVNFIRSNRESRGSGYRVALVVFRDLDYGLARMFEAYSQDLPFQLQIFKNLKDAESWLSIMNKSENPNNGKTLYELENP